jgi:hypothetical protein
MIPLAGSPAPLPDNVLYWIGPIETEITDGSTTVPVIKAHYVLIENPTTGANPSQEGWYETDSSSSTGYKPTMDITVEDGKDYYLRVTEEIMPETVSVVQYNKEEFAWDGDMWHSFGKANFGSLAFVNSVEASYQPAGTVSVTEAPDTTTTVTPFGSGGTTPFFTMDGENAIFNPGTAATAGEAINVVTASGARSATFTGTSVTIESTAQ